MDDNADKVYAWTPMIRMSDMKYPVYFRDFLQEHTNVTQGDWVWESSMSNNYQYFVVRESEIPDGDVVTEGVPHQGEDGRWYKTWEVRSFTEEEVSENLSSAKESNKEAAFNVFLEDLKSGVNTISRPSVPVEPREIFNPSYLRAYSQSNPEKTILIPTEGFVFEEVDQAGASSYAGEVEVRMGEIQQNLFKYLSTLYSTKVIENIPEVPDTFV